MRCHYMQKDDGPVIQVALNEWARRRRDGFEFRTEKDFNDQDPEIKAAAQGETKKKAGKKKVMKRT